MYSSKKLFIGLLSMVFLLLSSTAIATNNLIPPLTQQQYDSLVTQAMQESNKEAVKIFNQKVNQLIGKLPVAKQKTAKKEFAEIQKLDFNALTTDASAIAFQKKYNVDVKIIAEKISDIRVEFTPKAGALLESLKSTLASYRNLSKEDQQGTPGLALQQQVGDILLQDSEMRMDVFTKFDMVYKEILGITPRKKSIEMYKKRIAEMKNNPSNYIRIK